VRRRAAAAPWPALVLLACLACGDADEAPHEAPSVTLSPVRAVDLVEHIEATGELVAKERAPIAAEVGGRITEVLVDEGTRVEAGTPVLAIDPERRRLERDSAQARADEAEAALREQERELRRVSDLRARKVASQTQLEQAETARKLAQARHLAAEAELGVLERALRDATVAAPFSGYVARRHVGRGEYVQPGTPLFELVSLDPIEVEFSVTEVDSGRVAAGQEVGVRLAPFPDETFGATVSFVSPTIDPTTRTLRVKAQLENREGKLRPGLFARVDLGISERSGVPMVPEEAILQRSDGAVVFRSNGDHRVERLVIETGVHREGYVEVVRGLAPGELVVSRGQTWLSDGDVVTPREPDGTLAGAPPGAAAPGAAAGRP
jgi:membrane fusion protein (multidrug efflux system)